MRVRGAYVRGEAYRAVPVPPPQGPRPDADLQRKEALRLYRDVIRSARHFTWTVVLPPLAPALP